MRITRRAASVTAILVSCAAIGERASSKEIVHAAALGVLSQTSHIKKLDLSGTSLGELPIAARTISVDHEGNIYATFLGGNFASRFDSNGVGLNVYFPTGLPGDGALIVGGSAIGPDGKFYLAVSGGLNRIERFDVDGTSLGVYGTTPASLAASLAYDASGNLYAGSRSAIYKFDPNGVRTNFASVPGQLTFDLALDSFGNLFAAGLIEGPMWRIWKFNAAGSLIQTINPGFEVDAVAFDSDDILYAGGRDLSIPARVTIRRFSATGTPLGTFYQFPAQIEFIDDLAIANVVPEPSSAVLLISACIGLPRFRRRMLMLEYQSALST
jgi:hypothetical protein